MKNVGHGEMPAAFLSLRNAMKVSSLFALSHFPALRETGGPGSVRNAHKGAGLSDKEIEWRYKKGKRAGRTHFRRGDPRRD